MRLSGILLALFLSFGAGAEVPPSSDVPLSLPGSSSNKDFTGYYILGGKMFHYDQNTGAFQAVSENNAKGDTQKAQGGPSEPDRDAPLERNFKEGVNEFRHRTFRLADLAQDETGATGDFACMKWGSPLLDSDFESKEDCNNALEQALDKALIGMDKYIDSFEKDKRVQSLSAELEEYEKLSKMKIDFPDSKQDINKGYKKGCVCLD